MPSASSTSSSARGPLPPRRVPPAERTRPPTSSPPVYRHAAAGKRPPLLFPSSRSPSRSLSRSVAARLRDPSLPLNSDVRGHVGLEAEGAREGGIDRRVVGPVEVHVVAHERRCAEEEMLARGPRADVLDDLDGTIVVEEDGPVAHLAALHSRCGQVHRLRRGRGVLVSHEEDMEEMVLRSLGGRGYLDPPRSRLVLGPRIA